MWLYLRVLVKKSFPFRKRKFEKFLALVEFCSDQIWAKSSVNGPHMPTSTHSYFPYINATKDEYRVEHNSLNEHLWKWFIRCTLGQTQYSFVNVSYRRGKKPSIIDLNTLSSIFNRLKGREMASCHPVRTGAGLCQWVRLRACGGKVHGPFTSRKTHRGLALLCATSLSIHQNLLSTVSR